MLEPLFGASAAPVCEPIKCKYFCPVDFVDLSGRMERVAVFTLCSWQADPDLQSKQNLLRLRCRPLRKIWLECVCLIGVSCRDYFLHRV